MSSIERSLVRSLPWLFAGLLASLPLLLFPQPSRLLLASTVHLSIVVGLGLALTYVMLPLADDSWFSGARRGIRLFASAAGIVALVTGVVALVTLASAAALRLQPSLQFLQLLSALDIAWAGAAIMIGAHRGWGKRASALAGIALGVACVWSIWRYLDTVGFAADGGWLLDGGKLMTIVIPADMIAAAVALLTLALGTRRMLRSDHRTAQASVQS